MQDQIEGREAKEAGKRFQMRVSFDGRKKFTQKKILLKLLIYGRQGRET